MKCLKYSVKVLFIGGNKMDKDIDKIIKRLLIISQMIIDEFEVMANLSYKDLENTQQFNDHIEDTKNYLNNEAVIINNLDIDTLKELFKRLANYDDNSLAYERTILNIDNQIERLQYDNDLEIDEDTNYDEDVNDDYHNIEEQDENNGDFIQKYYLDTGELEKYELATIDYMAINTLKKMTDRITNTYTDNKKDAKFKKRLLKDLKTFKYIVLGLDLNLEKIGVNYRFNLERIPYMIKPEIDTSIISYNQCIAHLKKLYDTEINDNSLKDINENLFNMMCLDSFLDELDNELLNRLLALCDELEEKATYSFYGNIAKEKILRKRKTRK